VNAVAVMYVNSHLADLRAEARSRRADPLIEKRSLRARLASRTAGFRKVLGSDNGPVVPQLKNYPYGG
jgi:hypothetical protein